MLFQTAGFLALVSSEVSAFMICLITLDRFVVLRFPFTRYRFKRTSALAVCLCAWTAGVVIATFPLINHWSFYGQTSICLPLPVTRKSFPGQRYAFNIMILLNFALFVFIALGQAAIFVTVRTSSLKSSSGKQSSELVLVYRLASVVVSDFLCWFPIGVLGLMAANDYPVPSEVNVALAILVLPLNSALNPFLYTLNMVLEKRRAKRLHRLTQNIEARLRAEMVK